MSKLNTKTKTNTLREETVNHEGSVAWKRTPKEELFLAAVTSLNEDSFYETAAERSKRVEKLVNEVADDAQWLQELVKYVRHTLNLRTSAIIVAVEAVRARLKKGLQGGNREIVFNSLGRLDEPSEFLAYWTSVEGKKIPSAVKRGINDWLVSNINEYNVLKWVGKTKRGDFSLRDVINLTHPTPKTPEQNALFKYVLDDGYGKFPDVTNLPMIATRKVFLNTHELDPGTIKAAGLTHEAIAGVLGTIPANVWEMLVPTMGDMALRMNLRRINESGVSQETVDFINKRLSEGDSKALPIQLYSAYKNAPLDFSAALQKAANKSLENVPRLTGRTLVLLDKSYSMSSPMSSHGTLCRQDVANVFAAALALRGENVDVIEYNEIYYKVDITSKDLLRVVEIDMPVSYGGTRTSEALADNYHGHDRVIIITDEQDTSYYFGDISVNEAIEKCIPKNVNVYTWNIAGYAPSHNDSLPNAYTFGGLSDKGFEMIPIIEEHNGQKWPWEK